MIIAFLAFNIVTSELLMRDSESAFSGYCANADWSKPDKMPHRPVFAKAGGMPVTARGGVIFRDYRLSQNFLAWTQCVSCGNNVLRCNLQRSGRSFGQPVLMRGELRGVNHLPSECATQIGPRGPGQSGAPLSVITRCGFPTVRTQSFRNTCPA